MKKRNKKYRPKHTHAPSFIYSLTLGELTEGDRARSDIHPYVHLDVLRRGEGNEEDAWHVQSALRHAWVLSQGFEEKTHFPSRVRLAQLHGAAQEAGRT